MKRSNCCKPDRAHGYIPRSSDAGCPDPPADDPVPADEPEPVEAELAESEPAGQVEEPVEAEPAERVEDPPVLRRRADLSMLERRLTALRLIYGRGPA